MAKKKNFKPKNTNIAWLLIPADGINMNLEIGV